MFAFLTRLLLVVRSRMRSQARLKAENLVLRQQVLIMSRKSPTGVRLRNLDRLVLVWLYLHPECDHGGQGGDCNPVAPPRLPSFLALEPRRTMLAELQLMRRLEVLFAELNRYLEEFPAPHDTLQASCCPRDDPSSIYLFHHHGLDVRKELHVQDLESSLAFWRDACGFQVAYRRTEERFVFLERAGAQVMLSQRHSRYETGTLDEPFDRRGSSKSMSKASNRFCLFSTHSTGRSMSRSAIAGIGLATERKAGVIPGSGSRRYLILFGQSLGTRAIE